MATHDDARDRGLLLRCAVDHTLSPVRHDVYGRLLDGYQSDPDLRTLFDEVTARLGVRVLTADRTPGLGLTAESDSPLAVTDTQRWRRARAVADRTVYGLVTAGICAWCYPRAGQVRHP